MTKKLSISDKLNLPLDWLTLATVVYGARGSGKTSFGRVAAEEVSKAGQRFCAIDLKGDWYGLKSSANGKGEGLPVVVFGGEHADVPLEPDAGKFVGETVAKLGQSSILDFELLSKGKQIRFLADFFEALYHHNRDPLLVLADEAQRYAPQKPGPEEARCLGAVQDAVKLGRKHGLGLVLFTQRGAGLNKEVSELCDMMVAFRTPGPLDQERVRDWLDANATKAQRDQVMGQLSGLETGTAVFASGHPELKVFGVYPVRRPETFDSSATPKVGKARAEPKKLAKPDLDELKAKMAAAIERAKADDPKALRAEIAELKRQAAKPPPAPPAPKFERVEVPTFNEDEFGQLFETLNEELDAAIKRATEAKTAIGRALVNYRQLQRAALKARTKPTAVAPVAPASTVPVKPEATYTTYAREGVKSAEQEDVSLPPAQRSLLQALAQYGDMPLSRAALIAGYSASKSTMRNGAGNLRTLGLISGTNDHMSITHAGSKVLGPVEALPTGAELLNRWCDRIPPAQAALLRAVVAEHPKPISLTEAANNAGLDPGVSTVRNGAGTLRTLGLIQGSNDSITASESLVS